MTAVVGSWAVWVPAHVVNFAYVPPQQRLLYINGVQVFYNVFLSFIGNKKVSCLSSNASYVASIIC
jgi:protein Mpv17